MKITLRQAIGLPFRSVGVLFFLLYETIAGDKTTYRANDVLNIYKTKAKCSKCGHEGFVAIN